MEHLPANRHIDSSKLRIKAMSLKMTSVSTQMLTAHESPSSIWELLKNVLNKKAMTKDNIWPSEVLGCTFSLEQTFFILAAPCLKFTDSPRMYFEMALLDTYHSSLTTMEWEQASTDCFLRSDNTCNNHGDIKLTEDGCYTVFISPDMCNHAYSPGLFYDMVL